MWKWALLCMAAECRPAPPVIDPHRPSHQVTTHHQHTPSTHPINTPHENTLSTLHSLVVAQPLTHSPNPPSRPTLLKHPLTPFFQPTFLPPSLSTLTLPPSPPGGPLAKRARPDDGIAMGPSVTSGSFFFGMKGTNRDGTGGSSFKPPPPNLIPPSATAKTLFVGGLSRETGEEEIRRSLPDVMLVRKPDGKSYAFVDFHSHATAKQVMVAIYPVMTYPIIIQYPLS